MRRGWEECRGRKEWRGRRGDGRGEMEGDDQLH